MLKSWPEAWAAELSSATRPLQEAASDDHWRDLLFVIFKWLPEMALIIVLGIATGFGYVTLLRGQLYETTAKLYVRLGIDQAPPPSLSTDRSVTYLSQTRGAVQSEVDLLHNASLIDQLIRENNLTAKQEPRTPTNLVQWIKRGVAELIDALRETLDQVLAAIDLKVVLTPSERLRQQITESLLIETSLNSDIISVTLRWPDRTSAATVLDRFIELYLRFRSALFESDQEILFLEHKRDEARQSIDAIEAKKAEFERSHDARNLANRVQLLEADVLEARRTFEKARLELELTEQRLSRLRSWNVEQSDTYGFGTIPADSPSASIANTIAELLGERGRLRRVVASNSPDARQIKEIDAKLAAVRNVLEQQFEAEIQDRLRTNEQARNRFERVTASLGDMQVAATTLNSLDRQREIAEDRYRDAEKRLADARDIESMRKSRLSNVVSVQPAVTAVVPFGLRNMTIMGLIAVVSSLFAAVWAVLREFFDTRLFLPQQSAQRLGLLLVGVLPNGPRHPRDWILSK